MRIVMMGTGTFAEPTFEAVLAGPHPVVGLVTQPDRTVGQERGSTRQVGKGMKNIALAHGIHVFQPESINTSESVEGLRAMQPDLLVVAAYGQILSKNVLSVPPQGGINVHASLLPKYRGAAPVAWAIYHGEKKTGVTIIRMSVQLDAGDMLLQEAVDIGPQETAGELEARLAVVGARLATSAVDMIAAGKAQGVKQNKSQATKAPKLTKEHGLIDWNRSPDEIMNQVRAMQPWPTAYTFFHRQGKPPLRVVIPRAAVPTDFLSMEFSRSSRRAGEAMCFPEPPRLWAATGIELGFVEILELQPAGKKRMTTAEFLRGHAIREGDRFGPEQP
jgi:methionyl-tRNA formyltransferase